MELIKMKLGSRRRFLQPQFDQRWKKFRPKVGEERLVKPRVFVWDFQLLGLKLGFDCENKELRRIKMITESQFCKKNEKNSRF